MMPQEKDPKVNVPPPPRKTRGIQAEIPTGTVAEDTAPATNTTISNAQLDNMSKPNSGLQDLNFKVGPDFHMAFKTTAALKNMPMKNLLEASFRCWVEKYGDDKIKSLFPLI